MITINRKRVLFFNAKREKCNSTSPHLGLAMLAAVLKKRGHKVLVVDYQFKHTAPSPETFIKDFNPDVLGITLYTATIHEANKIINNVSNSNIPIMVGGPHATLYYDELSTDNRLDYIIRGEAENVIEEIVQNAKHQSKSQIITVKPPDVENLIYPDFTSFFKYKEISVYPLSTSRGCPYNCSFCAIHLLSSRKWRPRKPDDCIIEVIEAKRRLLNLHSVTIYDDNSMVRKEHIKDLLKRYINKNIDLPITISNTRADGLDEEIIVLLKKAKCPNIGLGVEHGHPEVFKQVEKGETLEDIKKAAKLIKKYKMSLFLCFVIGLEGDSLEKTKYSINLAKELKPDHIYWNMITPFKGTRIREWYDQHGRIFDVINHSSYVDGNFMCDEPCAETPDFGIEERKKAYLMAIMETNDIRLKLKSIPRLIPYVTKYKLYREFFYWLPNRIKKNFVLFISLVHKGLRIYKEKGMKELKKRIYYYFRR